ncbi:MAG: hypothetical protein KF782_10170 [Labilithrix sp.]|nr:hypothetical protein [Labilithrix sp.]
MKLGASEAADSKGARSAPSAIADDESGITSDATMRLLGSTTLSGAPTVGGNIAGRAEGASTTAGAGGAATGASATGASAESSSAASTSSGRKLGALAKTAPTRSADFAKSSIRLSRSKTIQGVDTGRRKARTSLSMRARSG